MKELSKEKLEELERDAELKFPSDDLDNKGWFTEMQIIRAERAAYISCAKEYELKMMDKEEEITRLKEEISRM